MHSKFQLIMLVLNTILAGLLAGFFYTWSFTIMQSLGLTGESSASVAMISINANIRDGWFAALFFGAPLTILLSLVIMAGAKGKGIVLWLFLALGFAISTLVITFTIHLPLNDELAAGVSWSSYVGPWVQWNHVRLVTSLLAFISMLCALVHYVRAQSRVGIGGEVA